MLQISRLTIENLTKEVVTDNPFPRISFAIKSDKHEVFLENATVSCNGWEITTKEQIAICYNGEKLNPYQTYEVTVKATDNNGETTHAKMTFETGRMESPWNAKWITDGSYNFTKKKTSPLPMTFIKAIKTDKKIKSAKIYSTAMGIYQIEINDKLVGEDYFAPGFTSYKHQLQYQTYDVTKMLSGEDTLVCVVAGGWAVGAFNYKRVNRTYAKRQALLLEIRIEYFDGEIQTISTDESWKVTENGNFQMAEFYDGETFDKNIDVKKLNSINASVENLKISPKIISTYGSLVKAHEVMTPESCFIAQSGAIIYDFGQNFAGVISAKINGKKGQVVTFKHAEILMNGELYTEPLRSAKATATYVCAEGEQSYSPRLTYMGFRFVSVHGIDQNDIELSAFVLYSDIEQIGKFECSDSQINKLQSNICWSAKSNFVDIPTDCPQRDERMGWTGDIALFAKTANFNFDMSRFYEKWLLDVATEQNKGGGIPMTIPNVVVPFQYEIMFPMAVDHWGDVCVLTPYAEYLSRGEVKQLEKMYFVMKKYVKACKFWAELFSFGKHRRIWKLLHHYGDWCAPNENLSGWMGKGKWTATASLANTSNIVSKIAKILGKEDDERYYHKLYEETCDAYIDILTDKNGKLKKEFQTGYVLPLYYDIFKGDEKRNAARNLARLVKDNAFHIGTGFPGTPYVLFALADNGEKETAFKMLRTDSYPSWLYEVKTGATTIWERWDGLKEDGTCNTGSSDGTSGMLSFNHYASGAVGDFLYRRIAGIEPIDGGYRNFKIEPMLGGEITFAKARTLTPYGEIASEWKIVENIFEINVEIPTCTNCTLTLPDKKEIKLASGEYSFTCDLN